MRCMCPLTCLSGCVGVVHLSFHVFVGLRWCCARILEMVRTYGKWFSVFVIVRFCLTIYVRLFVRLFVSLPVGRLVLRFVGCHA